MKSVSFEGPRGLYIHIPFCRYICHYCDFAKTANFRQDHVSTYMKTVLRQLKYFLENFYPNNKFTSVFFGGGTPGLFSLEYRPILEFLAGYLGDGAEISLEANPEDINEHSLSTWSDLGFNRLSMGIQTFSPIGLELLTRRHSRDQSIAAIEASLSRFENVNIDLIYGWSGQTSDDWCDDLDLALRLGLPHLSLYNLTYEPGTVLTRKRDKGRLLELDESRLELMYSNARSILEGEWIHDEVSNWSKPGFSCKHNWIYWQDEPYLALGCGAHGYLPGGSWGTRYHFCKSLRSYLRASEDLESASLQSYTDYLMSQGASVEANRSADDWLLENVGAGLRSSRGVDVARVKKLLNCKFVPSKILQTGIDMGLVHLTADRLTLKPEEWFRETSWALELVNSFVT